MSKPTKNTRELLTAIGIGHFNATMIVPYMFISPVTTDPKSSQTILIVQHLQKILFELGATDVPQSGRLDEPTALALAQVSGPDWARMSWAANISSVVSAKESGVTISPSTMMAAPDDGVPVAVSGALDFLPDVPGGLLTYALGGYLLYRHFKGARR